MIAVIFRATIKTLDDEYAETAARLRTRALERYGCLEFLAVTEGDQEVAISYWPDEAAVRAWKNDPEHTLSRQTGRKQWYEDYSVQVAEVVRAYEG